MNKLDQMGGPDGGQGIESLEEINSQIEELDLQIDSLKFGGEDTGALEMKREMLLGRRREALKRKRDKSPNSLTTEERRELGEAA